MTNPRVHSPALLLAIVAAGCAGDKTSAAGEDEQAMVAIRPAVVTLAPGGSAEFSVVVKGAVTSILWSVVEASGGSVSQDGVYTAPARPGVFHVVAVVIDETHTARSATAEVTVTNRDRGSRDGGSIERPRDAARDDTRDGGSRDVGMLDGNSRDLGSQEAGPRDSGSQDGATRDLEAQEAGESQG